MHAAVDTRGHLLALRVTPANAQDREQIDILAEQVQEVTGELVRIAYVDHHLRVPLQHKQRRRDAALGERQGNRAAPPEPALPCGSAPPADFRGGMIPPASSASTTSSLAPPMPLQVIFLGLPPPKTACTSTTLSSRNLIHCAQATMIQRQKV